MGFHVWLKCESKADKHEQMSKTFQWPTNGFVRSLQREMNLNATLDARSDLDSGAWNRKDNSRHGKRGMSKFDAVVDMAPEVKRRNIHDEAQAEGELHAGSERDTGSNSEREESEQDNGKASEHEDSHNSNAGKRRGSRFDAVQHGNLGETPEMEGKPHVRIDVKNDCGAVLRSCLIGLDELLKPSSIRFFRSTSCVEYVPVMAYTGFADQSICASDSAAHFGNTAVLDEGVHCIASNQQSPPDQQFSFEQVVIMRKDRYNCPDRWSDLIVGDDGILESLQEGYGADGFVLGLTFWGQGQAYMDDPTPQHVQHSDMRILRALLVSGFFNPLSPKWGIGQNVILVDKGPSMAFGMCSVLQGGLNTVY